MSKKKVTFNEHVTLYQQALGPIFVAVKKAITTEEELRQRHSPFQQKRRLVKQRIHLNHLARKARREARKAKRL